MKKILLVVLDGLGDIGKDTPLETAAKPNIDKLASAGKIGLLDFEYKKKVDSDLGYLRLLSCFSEKEYPGRGYLEALGAGLKPGKDDICIRANFATVDREGKLLDRRAGRDEYGLDKLAKKLDGIEINGIEFSVKKTSGHRLVILMSGKGLSIDVNPNDPYKTGVSVKQISFKKQSGKFTASVLNKFLYRSNKILSGDYINKKRKLPANTILIRNFGRRVDVKSFRNRYGLKACCIAGIAITKGVSRFLGINIIDVKGATGLPDTNLKRKFDAAKLAIKKYDLVFLHINGTDILSHDGKREEKARFIEKIDGELGYFLRRVNLNNVIVCLTSDHRTCSLPNYKHYQHIPDPVPIIVSGGGLESDGIRKFDEESVKGGSLRLRGNQLIPYLLKLEKKF